MEEVTTKNLSGRLRRYGSFKPCYQEHELRLAVTFQAMTSKRSCGWKSRMRRK
jgi:hypothetical protein